MADISTDLYNIQTAARGETVRDAVVDAIKKINTDLNPKMPKAKFKPRGAGGLKTRDNKSFLVIPEM